MTKVLGSAVVVAGLVFALSGAASWGQVPSTNDKSDANRNTGGGTGALRSPMLSGTDNTAYGKDALQSNTTGTNNTATGDGALVNNTTGSNNTASGFSALFGNNGDNNTASGYNALADNTTSTNNTASGALALVNNSTGTSNTATGAEALEDDTSGGYNTAAGYKALNFNTTGYNNTASGVFALYSNNGNENTAAGSDALAFNATGSFNTASGAYALYNKTRGDANTAHGHGALLSNTIGSYNTALGYRALYNSTGGRNLALGYNAGYKLTSGDFNIYTGNTAVASEFNTMRLGQGAVTANGITSGIARTFIAGIYNVPLSSTNNPVQVFIGNKGQLGTLVSSARYKRDIRDMREGSQGLYHLRPVTFRYKQDPQGPRQYGLIAEEVAKVYPELVTKGVDGKVESVQYHELIPMLLNEVQRQQQKLEAQAQELSELRAQNVRLQAALAQQNAALAARLERLEQGATHTATVATR